jgi:hypothetical protein
LGRGNRKVRGLAIAYFGEIAGFASSIVLRQNIEGKATFGTGKTGFSVLLDVIFHN